MINELERHLESLDPDTRRQLDADFRGVVKAVNEYKGVGTFTMKITVKPNGNKAIVATTVTGAAHLHQGAALRRPQAARLREYGRVHPAADGG